MLELMNEFAIHVNVTWGREAAIKVHCSTGQICDGYLDPRSDEPINFNFLPVSEFYFGMKLKWIFFYLFLFPRRARKLLADIRTRRYGSVSTHCAGRVGESLMSKRVLMIGEYTIL